MVNGGGWAVVCGGFQGLVSPNPTAVLVALLLGLWLSLSCNNQIGMYMSTNTCIAHTDISYLYMTSVCTYVLTGNNNI